MQGMANVILTFFCSGDIWQGSFLSETGFLNILNKCVRQGNHRKKSLYDNGSNTLEV